MKIGEIRNVLDRSGWIRNDLSGHTPAEFKRANVVERMTTMIAELEALQIAPRFTHEVERRAHEVESCRAVAARWVVAVVKPSYKPTCQEGGTRHVWLGAMNCRLCGTAFVQ